MEKFSELKDYMVGRLRNELDSSLTYHSARHTLDVIESTERLGVAENVNGEEMDLLLVAALFHDSGFLLSMDEHEAHGCILAREILPDHGFTTDAIDEICKLIMATKLPQTPENLLEQIICDADLDYLGRKDFFTLGEGLFTEFLSRGIVKDFCDWDNLQIKFLSGHRFFTQSSLALREPVKMQHLVQVKERIKDCNSVN